MKLIREIIVYLSVFLLPVNVSCSVELRLLLSIFGHGDRYPIAFDEMKHAYQRNPHANVSWFSDSVAGLTKEGNRRAFEHGEILRKQYGKWLGSINSRLIEFRSSHVERTIATSSLVAAGLFPPSDDQRWNSRLNWQPIPLNDNVLYHGVFCSKHRSIFNDTQSKDPTMIEYNKDTKEFYEYVSRNTGGPIDNRFLYYLCMEFLTAVLHKESDTFIEKFIPGCDGILSSLEIFRNIFAKVIPWNDTLECGTIQY